MYMIAIKYGSSVVRRLRDEEDGLALTEYLILLGLLTAVVVGAVLTFGNNLGAQWDLWAEWLTGLNAPPDLDAETTGGDTTGGDTAGDTTGGDTAGDTAGDTTGGDTAGTL